MNQEINIKGCSLQGVSFGNNNTIINNNSIEDEMTFFIKQSEKVLDNYDPDSKQYIALNTAVTYAKRNQKEKFIEALKKHSLDIWKDIFSNVAASGVIYLIQRWIS